MTKTRLVKPLRGLRVFGPYGREVPEEGAIVPWVSYWQRRVREGSLEIVAEPKKAPAKSKPKANEDNDQ